MYTFQTNPIASQDESHIAARCKLYSILAETFRYPDQDFRTQVKDGRFEEAYQSIIQELPYEMGFTSEEKDRINACKHIRDEDIEVEFIRLFEAGPGSPPCPLLEGLYREDRKIVFKDLISFYNHFGLSYEDGSMEDRPDNICYELEFLHYLTFKELYAVQKGNDPGPYQRAQKDFLQMHPLRFVDSLISKMEEIEGNLPSKEEACIEVFRFYLSLFRFSQRFLESELQYLQTVNPAPDLNASVSG